MDLVSSLTSAAVIGGLVIAQTFLVSAEARRAVLFWAPIGLLGAIAGNSLFTDVQAGTEWIATLIVFAAAATLTDDKFARVLGAAAGMALVPAVLAGASFLEVAWSSIPLSLAAASAALVVGGAVGYALRSFRSRAVFSEIALLVLLCSLAIMAGPTALVGWQRAAIAAEGDESSYTAPSLWCLLPVGLAFVGGFAWRLWRIYLSEERKRT